MFCVVSVALVSRPDQKLCIYWDSWDSQTQRHKYTNTKIHSHKYILCACFMGNTRDLNQMLDSIFQESDWAPPALHNKPTKIHNSCWWVLRILEIPRVDFCSLYSQIYSDCCWEVSPSHFAINMQTVLKNAVVKVGMRRGPPLLIKWLWKRNDGGKVGAANCYHPS